MGFMSSYKHLEKLCGEVMNDERKVSAYIDEMIQTPSGAGLVSGWSEDLKRLKHYRWIRNQIVHEPDASEENMCDSEDVQWLDDFYDRIMDQTDPLALYRKVTQRTDPVYRSPAQQAYPTRVPSPPIGERRNQSGPGCGAFLLGTVALLVLMLF